MRKLIDSIINSLTRRSIEPTGIVDKDTWYRLVRIYVSVKKISELNSEGVRLEDVSKQFPQPLNEGDSGNSVRVLQYFLALKQILKNITNQLPLM